MSKHTSGPWHVSADKGFATGNGQFLGIYKTGDDLEIIAKVHKDVLLVHGPQDHRANAALISAAPDLLEACQARVTANTTEELEAADSLMRAAIAKATTVNF